MFQSRSTRIILVFILSSLAIILVQGLFIDVTRDSGKYATVAREIFLRGNWLELTVHGDPYLQKPPLMFWLSAISFHLFGVSNFSFKLPILLFSLFGLYFTYRLGKSLYNKTIGLLSAGLLLFSEFFLLYNTDLHTDSLLLPFVIFSIWQLYEYLKHAQTSNLILGFTGIGLGMLTKGPIGAALPAFAVGTHLLLKKDFRRIFDLRWLLGIAVALMVLSPALLGIFRQFGMQGIFFFFWTNNVGRVTGEYLGTNTDPFFFVHTLLYMLLPWSLFFFVASYNEFRRIIRKRVRSIEFITLGGIWIFFLILSISRSKLPNYIYAISPLMAILTSKWIFFAFKKQSSLLFKIFSRLQTTTEWLLWVLVVFISVYLFPIQQVLIILPLLAFFSIYLYLQKNNHTDNRLLRSMLTMTALCFLLNFHVFPDIYAQQAVPLAARIFNQKATETENLYNYKYGQYELFFYGKKEAIQIKDEQKLKEIVQLGQAWIFTNEEGYREICAIDTTLPSNCITAMRHTSLNKGIRYINPQTREKSKDNMYLIHFK